MSQASWGRPRAIGAPGGEARVISWRRGCVRGFPQHPAGGSRALVAASSLRRLLAACRIPGVPVLVVLSHPGPLVPRLSPPRAVCGSSPLPALPKCGGRRAAGRRSLYRGPPHHRSGACARERVAGVYTKGQASPLLSTRRRTPRRCLGMPMPLDPRPGAGGGGGAAEGLAIEWPATRGDSRSALAPRPCCHWPRGRVLFCPALVASEPSLLGGPGRVPCPLPLSGETREGAGGHRSLLLRARPSRLAHPTHPEGETPPPHTHPGVLPGSSVTFF